MDENDSTTPFRKLKGQVDVIGPQLCDDWLGVINHGNKLTPLLPVRRVYLIGIERAPPQPQTHPPPPLDIKVIFDCISKTFFLNYLYQVANGVHS